jgi:putative transposase
MTANSTRRANPRSIGYEEVYLKAYDSAPEAHTSIGRYLDLLNRRQPHSSIDGSAPCPF